MESIEILKEFMLTEAVSGYEKKMAYLLKTHLENHCDEVTIDRAGNVIGKINGTDNQGPVPMIFAHMDQLGFIIRKIENSGLIQIDRLGGVPEKVLPALEVLVSTVDGQYIEGIIGVKSHHATIPEEKYKVDVVTSLYVDVGAKSKEEVMAQGIRVGCPILYRPSFKKLMGNMVCGTAADNRGGCTALVEIASRLAANRPKVTTYIVGTVWEEFNIRGAVFAARKIKPDLAICIDISLAGDTPDLSNKYDVVTGGGPTMSLYNFHGRGTLNGTIAHKGLSDLAERSALEKGINLQRFATVGMLTDSAYVQMEGDYIPCLDMGYATRYAHTPVETFDFGDLLQLCDLLTAMVENLDSQFKLGRY